MWSVASLASLVCIWVCAATGRRDKPLAAGIGLGPGAGSTTWQLVEQAGAPWTAHQVLTSGSQPGPPHPLAEAESQTRWPKARRAWG